MLDLYAKKWCFQKEMGEESYEHFQGRLSLTTKIRFNGIKKIFDECGITKYHLSPTSISNQGNVFYVTKELTRIDGPWKNTSEDEWYPTTWKDNAKRILPWQQFILDRLGFERDKVYLVFNPAGLAGKTELMGIAQTLGFTIYDLNGVEKPDRMIYNAADMMRAANDRDPSGFFLDIPKSRDQKAAWAGIDALEQLTRQQIIDTRNNFNGVWRFNLGSRWIFTNNDPSYFRSKMSAGRWEVYKLEGETMVPYTFE